MNELQDFRLDDLYEKMQLEDDEFQDWLVSLGLLNGRYPCTCGNSMKKKRRSSGQIVWECNRAYHRPTQIRRGYKDGTFFENSNISFQQVFKLSYLWAMNHSVEYAEYETQLAHRIVVSWYKKFRKICKRYFHANPIRLGGNGVIVEADETFMTRRHGGRGRPVRRRSKWLFGIVERGSGRSYYKIVRRRDSATLLSLILRHVLPNTVVHTDEWRAYRALARFPMFRHRFVNHGANFVDPQDRTLHTQTIEGKNGQWKEWVRRRHGVIDQIIPDLILEFNWRERFGRRNVVFFNFWSQVADMYPCIQ
jgi:IS1 family transposase